MLCIRFLCFTSALALGPLNSHCLQGSDVYFLYEISVVVHLYPKSRICVLLSCDYLGHFLFWFQICIGHVHLNALYLNLT